MLKWHIKEDIFNIIDSKEKAYWIGFLYADGYIQSNGNTFGLALKAEDIEQLKDFLTFLELKENVEEIISYSSNTNSNKVVITRKQTYQDLLNIGFTTNKSYDTSLTVWNNIPEQYKKEFILGLYDGDGTFSITPKGMQIATLISNNDNLIKAIIQYVNTYLGEGFMKFKAPTQGDPYPRIRLAQNKAKIFGDWLYDTDCKYRLKRKYNFYLQMGIREKARKGKENGQAKGIICIDNGNKYATAKECAFAEFGLSNPGTMNSIRSVCRGERKQTKGKRFRYMTSDEWEEFKNE